ncbi:TIGR03086 family protein [Streptomyces sp. ISL-1]|uniref:TIGR03086 family metal-binding protein n=1 Tax=Streptomyces sp. ISL-1 TaxID=2817657 RepID=UPI001BE73955|nr:TIGR03086 family metal-binding protein [Streptomyces sp. ISL-1]MBT2392774.1 TIGR03086 family protein [Streptomyces sp. ISL-1]
MTNTISDLLERASEHAVPVVRGITDERLADPTPCTEYDVRALTDHLIQVVINFQALAAKKNADFSSVPHFTDDGGDWRARFADETATLVAAWAAPGAEEGTSGTMGLPARTVGHMVLGDLTVHAWDLARATGQEFVPDPAVVGEIGPALAEMAPMARKWGVFGEPFPLPDEGGVSDFDRALALTGRDPHWRLPA